MRSSPAAGPRCSCCLSSGSRRAGVLGEPPPAPSTLDHLTFPLMTCELLSAGGTDCLKHTHTHTHTQAHTDLLSLKSSLFSFLSITEPLNQPLLVSGAV